MNVHSSGSGAYSSAQHDPLRLVNATIQAVDKIGLTTAEEIERTAEQVLSGANEVADELRRLSVAIREHSKVAGDHVTAFCNKATTVLDVIRDLQDKVLANGHAEERSEPGNAPLPKALPKELARRREAAS
jgi:hypothetical protein